MRHIKVLIHTGYWNKKTAINNPAFLFVFGDNDIQRGTKGQATIRYCKNSVGIPTKKFPNNKVGSYYTDKEYKLNQKKIDSALINIMLKSKEYKATVFPENGLGTGLAKLHIKAPKTYEYLNRKIYEIFDIKY